MQTRLFQAQDKNKTIFCPPGASRLWFRGLHQWKTAPS